MATVRVAPLATTPNTRKIPIPSLGAMFTSEWLKLRARAVFWWCIGAVAVIAIAVPIIGYFVVRSSNKPDKSWNGIIWPEAINVGAIVAGSLSVLPILVACLVIGSEYQWGTLRVIVGSGASRLKLILAKLFIMVIFTAIFTALAMVAGTISGTIVGVVTGKTATKQWAYDGTFALHILTTFALIVFAVMVTVVIGFTLTLLTRSLAVGIALAIAVNFLNGILGAGLALLGHIGKIIQDGLPSTNIDILTKAVGLSPTIDDTGKFIRALVICALYIIILSIICLIVFRRRDIQAGS